jgi:hypothetical protein
MQQSVYDAPRVTNERTTRTQSELKTTPPPPGDHEEWRRPIPGVVNSKTLKLIFEKAGIEPFTKAELAKIKALQVDFDAVSGDMAAHSFDAIKAAVRNHRGTLAQAIQKEDLAKVDSPEAIGDRMRAVRAALKTRKRAIATDAFLIVHGAMKRAEGPLAKYAPVLADEEFKIFQSMGFQKAIMSPVLEAVVSFEALLKSFTGEGLYMCPPKMQFYGIAGEYL